MKKIIEECLDSEYFVVYEKEKSKIDPEYIKEVFKGIKCPHCKVFIPKESFTAGFEGEQDYVCQCKLNINMIGHKLYLTLEVEK